MIPAKPAPAKCVIEIEMPSFFHAFQNVVFVLRVWKRDAKVESARNWVKANTPKTVIKFVVAEDVVFTWKTFNELKMR